MNADIFGKRLRDGVALRRVGDADGQAGDVLLFAAELAGQVMGEGHYALCIFQNGFPLMGQADLMVCAVKDAHAQLLLQLADMLADR